MLQHNASVGGAAFVEVGTTLRNLGLTRAAAASYSAALYFVPNASRVYGARAYARFQGGQFDMAASDWTRAMEIEKPSPRRLGDRASAYELLARYDDAINDYTAAIALDPQDARLLANRARIYRYVGKFELAATDYTTAQKLEPDFLAHVYLRGCAKLEGKRFAEAIADFESVLSREPAGIWARDAKESLGEAQREAARISKSPS